MQSHNPGTTQHHFFLCHQENTNILYVREPSHRSHNWPTMVSHSCFRSKPEISSNLSLKPSLHFILLSPCDAQINFLPQESESNHVQRVGPTHQGPAPNCSKLFTAKKRCSLTIMAAFGQMTEWRKSLASTLPFAFHPLQSRDVFWLCILVVCGLPLPEITSCLDFLNLVCVMAR